MEENRFHIFPAKVYARGFLEKTLILFARKNSKNTELFEPLLAEFDVEWEIFTKKEKKGKNNPLPTSYREPFVTPRTIAISTFLVIFALFSIFLGRRIFNFVRAPGVYIELPQNESVVSAPTIIVRGKTEQESRLTMNGREITVDEQGNFNEDIELIAGLNILEFLAQNRFGKTAKEIRYVMVK